MDDVRLTPAERRALSRIEGELRKDRDLDRAMRRMRLPGTRRRPLLGRDASAPPEATDRDGRDAGSADTDAVEDTAPPAGRDVPADESAGEAPRPAVRREASEDAPERVPGGEGAVGDRRRVWALTVVVSVLLAAVLTVGTPFFLLFTMVLVTLAATAGVVWIFVAFSLRRPGTG